MSSPRGDATREHLLHVALSLFRRRGFDATTMRDIAEKAGLSLGAAYHYFRSKEELLLSFYEWLQDQHERQVAAEPVPNDLRGRLARVFDTKLQLIAPNRRLLAALFSDLGRPAGRLSVFSPNTAPVRDRSIALFRGALDGAGLSSEMQEALGELLWLAHLGLGVFLLYDRSPGVSRTHRLTDATVDALASLLPLLTLPAAAPFVARGLELFRELGGLPELRATR